MGLRVYNTLTQRKEEFIPLKPGRVGMYVCGVTVYDVCHIGHARNAVVFDVIYRYLKHTGYDVTYVRNFTDVDDKIIQRAQQEGVSAEEIATRYIGDFNADMDALGLKRPTVEPKATEHIADMIQMIERLLEGGHAYVMNGDVFYAVETFSEYGTLSRRSLEEMRAGARVEVDERKRNPLDFALWKTAKPGEPAWDSPWGKGRPGWHIECSAMSQKYLGDTFDIHGGGKDLIFPHHENEIAQSAAAMRTPFVRYWLHNGFININREKMSKSLGNILTIKEILNEYHPEVVRLFLLSRHYRSPMDYSQEEMEVAGRNLERFYQTLAGINAILVSRKEWSYPGEGFSPEEVTVYRQAEDFLTNFQEAMDDDFNTAAALAPFFDLVRSLNRFIQHPSPHTPEILHKGKQAFVAIGEVLGIFEEPPETFLEGEKRRRMKVLPLTPETIDELVRQRTEARKQKNWARADAIRDQLAAQGITLEDTVAGTTWRVR